MQYKYLSSAMDHLDSTGSSPVISQWKGKDFFLKKIKSAELNTLEGLQDRSILNRVTVLKKQHDKGIPTSSRHETDRGSRQEMGVQLRSIHRHYANPEVVVRFRTQVHLIEDGSDVVLEETIESPRHL